MKLATYTPLDAQSPHSGIAVVDDGTVIDLNYAYASYLREVENETRAYELASARIPRDMIGFLNGGDQAIAAARQTVGFVRRRGQTGRGLSGERLSYTLAEVRLLAPIARPGKILAVGKNYADHLKEAGHSLPVNDPTHFPRGFVKVASTIVGPDDPVLLPHVTQELDYEVELAIVIGKRGRYIPRDKVYDHIAGYTILNDVSARDIQLAEAKQGNHLIGKNMDTLAPMGPWIVLKDEIPDPTKLRLNLSINGEMRQESSTAAMIHDIPAIVERWSWMTLEPGDVIATGTPGGVALSGKFPYLKVGDVMECTVEKIGRLRNAVAAEHS